MLPSNVPQEDIQLVIPNALQMGWSESPAFFCAATETARDLGDRYIAENKPMEPQPAENICMNIDWANLPTEVKQEEDVKIYYLLESYIDDFITMVQTTDRNELLRVTHCVLKAISELFPPPKVTGSVTGPAISPKKLEEEGAWEARKEILG